MATTEAPKTVEDAAADAEAPAPKKRQPKPKPEPKQREVRQSKADEKVQAVIDFVKAAKEPVTYDQIIEQMGWPKHSYDIVHFSLTALSKVGIVNKVGTWEGTGRARVAFEWAGKK